jgi:hypothetical protein
MPHSAPAQPSAKNPTVAISGSPVMTLHEIIRKARQKLNNDDWDYIVGGTETDLQTGACEKGDERFCVPTQRGGASSNLRVLIRRHCWSAQTLESCESSRYEYFGQVLR